MPARRKPAGKWRSNGLLNYTLICSGIVVIAILASGCATPQVVGVAEQVCRDWRQIGVDKADVITAETMKEIVGNNVSRDVWCAKKRA